MTRSPGSSRDSEASPNASIPYRPRVLRLVKVFGPTAIWAAYLGLLVPYGALRGVGAHTFRPYDVGAVERHLFSLEPTRFLQQHIYRHDIVWFDYGGFALHMSWFFLPLVLGCASCSLNGARLWSFRVGTRRLLSK